MCSSSVRLDLATILRPPKVLFVIVDVDEGGDEDGSLLLWWSAVGGGSLPSSLAVGETQAETEEAIHKKASRLCIGCLLYDDAAEAPTRSTNIRGLCYESVIPAETALKLRCDLVLVWLFVESIHALAGHRPLQAHL